MYTTTYEILACDLDHKVVKTRKWPLWARQLALTRLGRKAKKKLKGPELILLLELIDQERA